jgi:hypothetical protein
MSSFSANVTEKQMTDEEKRRIWKTLGRRKDTPKGLNCAVLC